MTNLLPVFCACAQLSIIVSSRDTQPMIHFTSWSRVTSLQAAGLPTALPRRALAARALATNAAVVHHILEGRSWLIPHPAVPVSAVRAVADGDAGGCWLLLCLHLCNL